MEGYKKQIAELTVKLKKKEWDMQELEADVEREKKGKAEVTKQLKEQTKQVEDMKLLLKSGEMSHDELKKKNNELITKIKAKEEDIRQRDE